MSSNRPWRRTLFALGLVALVVLGSAAWRTALDRTGAPVGVLRLPMTPVPLSPGLPMTVPGIAAGGSRGPTPGEVSAIKPMPARLRLPRPISSSPILRNAYQTVRVRIFSELHLKTLSVESAGGLYFLPKKLNDRGPVTLSIVGHEILVRRGPQIVLQSPRVTLRPLADKGVLTVKANHKHERRTVGGVLVYVGKDELVAVNTLDLESYVLGTVEPELGSLNLPVEAMKAQLVASRSYILALGDRHPRQEFDFCDSQHCQMFTGIGHYNERYLKAAADTRGVYLAYHHRPAAAFYHHACGGRTAAIEDIWPGPPIPYLQRIQDGPLEKPYCHGAYRETWHFIASNWTLHTLAMKKHWLKAPEALDGLRVIRLNPSGRVSQVLVQSSQPRWVHANEFRHAVNQAYGREVLLSTWFTVERIGSGWEFSGRGWGHGVGMCQLGAIGLAKRGYPYDKILGHYFPGAVLTHLPVQKTIKFKARPAVYRLLSRFTRNQN